MRNYIIKQTMNTRLGTKKTLIAVAGLTLMELTAMAFVCKKYDEHCYELMAEAKAYEELSAISLVSGVAASVFYMWNNWDNLK